MGQTPKNKLFMVYFDKERKPFFVGGFGIFGPHKKLGETTKSSREHPCAECEAMLWNQACVVTFSF